MTELIIPVWMVTSTVLLFVCTQSLPIWCAIVFVGAGVGIFLSSRFFVTWLVMMLCPVRHMSLVLYLCTGVTLKGISLYRCMSDGSTSVSSGMMWGSIWVVLIFARPGIIAFLYYCSPSGVALCPAVLSWWVFVSPPSLFGTLCFCYILRKLHRCGWLFLCHSCVEDGH